MPDEHCAAWPPALAPPAHGTPFADAVGPQTAPACMALLVQILPADSEAHLALLARCEAQLADDVHRGRVPGPPIWQLTGGIAARTASALAVHTSTDHAAIRAISFALHHARDDAAATAALTKTGDELARALQQYDQQFDGARAAICLRHCDACGLAQPLGSALHVLNPCGHALCEACWDPWRAAWQPSHGTCPVGGTPTGACQTHAFSAMVVCVRGRQRWYGIAVIPMGWLSAVGVCQHLHREMVAAEGRCRRTL